MFSGRDRRLLRREMHSSGHHPLAAVVAAAILSLTAACGIVAEESDPTRTGAAGGPGGAASPTGNAGTSGSPGVGNGSGSNGTSLPVPTQGGPDDGQFVPPGPAAPGGPPAGAGAPVISWLPIGPVGRGDPTWYLYLKSGNCDQLAEPGEQPESVQDVAKLFCLAVAGDEAAWTRGGELLAGLPVPDSDCWSSAANSVLRSVVDFRQRNPGVAYELVEGSGLACEPTFYDLDDDGSDNNGRNAAASVCGGTQMHMIGTLGGLPAGSIRSVVVGTQPEPTTVPVEPLGPDFVFRAPPSAREGSTTVSVADGDFLVTESVDMEYVGDPSACPGFEPPPENGPSVNPGEPGPAPGEPGPVEPAPNPGESGPVEPEPGPSGIPPSAAAARSDRAPAGVLAGLFR
jgi:hypothetical protein